MTNRQASLRHGAQPNPKIESAPDSNTEKEPEEWVSGDDPMTGAQTSSLGPCRRSAGNRRAFHADLTKAEASKRIHALKTKLKRVQHR
jgi:Protein of unknown function (DUF3072)